MAEDPDAVADEALVAYVRGRLPDAEAARIVALTAARPALAAEIALVRGIAADVDAEAAAPGPGALGWARIARALDAEALLQPVSPRRPLWHMAAAAAAAVVVWQLVAVPLLPGPEPRYQPATQGPAAGPEIAVVFAPEATEAELRMLLRAVGAEVVGGPSAVGLWRLAFPDAAARDAALARLAADPIVESAQAE
ncbi:MAG TPA: hypothetical protein VM422_03395 [Amaricoccus sp.]|nr:hypothetical protein [Amaricoccus sp.]